MSRYLLRLALLALPVASHASSPAAWAAFDAKVARACDRGSGFRRARTGRIVGFDDTLGKVVALVTGVRPTRTGVMVRVRALCVFDQRTGRVWLSEAGGWRSPGR